MLKLNFTQAKAVTALLMRHRPDKISFPLPAVIALAAMALNAPSMALQEDNQPIEQKLQPNADQSVDAIARQINRNAKWRILAAEPRVEEAKTVYRFKLLNRKRGRVKVIVIDPAKPNFQGLQ